jgi:hypothetical protein
VSDHRKTLAMLGMVPTSVQLAAMDYLALHGQRFCVEFGIDNCVQKAADLMVAQMEEGR